MKQIQSRHHDQFKWLKSLVSSASERREHGLAWIEGDRLCDAYLNSEGFQSFSPLDRCIAVFSSQRYQREQEASAHALFGDVWVLDEGLFDRLSEVESPSGRGLLIHIPEKSAALPLTNADDILILDRIQDPGNAGTLLRTAAAAGLTHVLSTQDTVDLWSPKVLRSAMGAHFYLSIHQGLSPDEAVALALGGRQLIATVLNPSSMSLFDKSLDLKKPTAWVFGREADGVSGDFLTKAIGVFVPQESQVESLNVAAAAAICLFEAKRQRLARGA